ncbi:MAG: TRAP transporter fused permease subunit [Alphaproteobacteria bacterium]|nr:TRAP transporter fused permease subunit [Alphaproteobacteria bacterium]MCB9928597.1 TRAP transporter fused permease subunit [Alphaproteobacteria bacterium]
MTSPSPEPGSVSAEEAVEQAEAAVDRHRKLSPFWWTILLASALLSIALSIYVIFGLGNRLGLYVPLETEYFYAMLGLLLPLVFLLYPPWAGVGPMDRVPWYDILIAAVTFGISIYFVTHGNEILEDGWEYLPPQTPAILAFVMWAIVLEAARRGGGLPIFFVCVILSIYPVYADWFPGVLQGQPTTWTVAAAFHIYGTESVLGIPMTAFANLVVGFLVFGVALQFTGGGAFFLNLAFAMLGKYRGGPAKVAIFASGLMGSMSGSVITNVLTTGVMTIPAMKRVGFRPAYAGGVEACASTGGVLMPPIMGATAFVMATYLEIPYGDIVLAAVIPSVLYYFGLFVQIDAYSARFKMKGLPVSELPRVLTVLKEGWYFIFVFALLIVMLLYMQREAQAPYYASLLLLLINQVSPRHRWNMRKLLDFLVGIGKLFTELAAILAGIGLIIGALTLSGKIGSIAYELVNVAGDSVIMLLILGAVTSFILGMGMTVTAAYLFLAVTVSPALVDGGLNKLAVHLFLLYWGMISFITPPVAIGAYAAASVAEASPVKTGFEAMRLGTVIYFVPFFFALNPALIGQGPTLYVIEVVAAALVGVALLGAALQGYLIGVGTMVFWGPVGFALRIVLFVGGVIMMLPGGKIVGYSNWELSLAAAVLIVPTIVLTWIANRSVAPVPAE